MIPKRETSSAALHESINAHIAYVYIFLIYFAALFLSAYFIPSIIRMDIFTNDMAEWTSWAYGFRDSALFNNDINAIYWIANYPPGYKAIFELLSPLIDPELLGKSLGFALAAVSTCLSFVLGRQITGGKVAGGIANVVFVSLCQFSTFNPISFINRESGGLPRGFALPIVLLGVISALKRDMRYLGGSIMLGALFYPPACIILGTYAALIIIYRIIKEKSTPDGVLIFGSLITVAAVILVFSSLSARQVTGPLYSFEQMLHMSEFWPGGIAGYFFHANWWEYLEDIFQLGPSVASIAWITLLVVTFYVGLNTNNNGNLITAEVIFIPISAVINYLAAYLLLLRLFEPSRYIVFPAQVLTLCCVPVLFDAALGWLAPALVKFGVWRVFDKRAWRIGSVLITILGVGVFSARVLYNRGGADTMPAEIYSFLGTLPKDALIAVTPFDGDRVPMRSHRSVLLIGGSLFPYHPQYYEEMKKRFVAMLATLYDAGPEALQHLRQQYGVRYYVLNKNLSQPDRWAELEPFKGYRLDFRSKMGANQPYVLGLANNATVFQKGDYSVLDLNRMGPLP